MLFLFELQEYHAEIDKLKLELQAARDKDGVFLPKDVYDQQLKAKESADNEIRELTLNLKAVEEQLENFKVRNLFFNQLFWKESLLFWKSHHINFMVEQGGVIHSSEI